MGEDVKELPEALKIPESAEVDSIILKEPAAPHSWWIQHTHVSQPREPSDWLCYLFGSRPDKGGLVWQPEKGHVPNFLTRFFMWLLFDCYWEHKK